MMKMHSGEEEIQILRSKLEKEIEKNSVLENQLSLLKQGNSFVQQKESRNSQPNNENKSLSPKEVATTPTPSPKVNVPHLPISQVSKETETNNQQHTEGAHRGG